MNQKEIFFAYMAKEHGLTMLDSEMEEMQRILFPPSYPYDIDDSLLTNMSDYGLIRLKSKIARELRTRKKQHT